jgi:2,5-diamino-6-(ribosylamino)-4(3H)-pyrimidinone 5'-phosphate reductase
MPRTSARRPARPSSRPYVICHMAPSVDGRIVPEGWPALAALTAEYERLAATFGASAWIVGRVSAEPYAGKAKLPGSRPGTIWPRRDFIAPGAARSYAIAIDPSGKLRWESGRIDGEQVVTVLTEQVPDGYLTFLRGKGVSYLFGGKRKIELPKVLRKLRGRLGIRRLLLEGGGRINGSFLAADLVDELSVLVAPVADGGMATATLFDAVEGRGPARRLKLLGVEPRRGGAVWIRYRVARGR